MLPLTVRQRNQLVAKLRSGEYSNDDAFVIVLWLIQRRNGYR